MPKDYLKILLHYRYQCKLIVFKEILIHFVTVDLFFFYFYYYAFQQGKSAAVHFKLIVLVVLNNVLF
jgi:hypothetical protein